MTVRSTLATVLALAAGAAALPASALAGPGDASATRAYIAADLALVQTARSHLLRSEHAPLEVLAQVRRDCPLAGAQSPQNPESTQMSDEVIGAMVLSAARPDTAAIRAFIAKANALRWSDTRLTRAVHTYTGKLTTLLALSVPHLCADVAAWSAGGFHSLPASTVAFVARFMPAWVALGELPGALKAHESPEQRAIASRCSHIEAELADGEARAVESWGKIMTELSLFP